MNKQFLTIWDIKFVKRKFTYKKCIFDRECKY